MRFFARWLLITIAISFSFNAWGGFLYETPIMMEPCCSHYDSPPVHKYKSHHYKKVTTNKKHYNKRYAYGTSCTVVNTCRSCCRAVKVHTSRDYFVNFSYDPAGYVGKQKQEENYYTSDMATGDDDASVHPDMQISSP